MELLIVTANAPFVPDMDLLLTDGSTVKNRELPLGERIECELDYASKSEFEKYYYRTEVYNQALREMTTTNVSEFERCVSEKCKSITGCIEKAGIINGETLVGFYVQPMFNDLITHIYNHVMGFAKTKPFVEPVAKSDEESSKSEVSAGPVENRGSLGDTPASD